VTTWPKVAIAGGSLGGLTAALLLRDLGCEVDVYERSEAVLTAPGAGIAVLSQTSRYAEQRLGMPVDSFCSSTNNITFFNADGSVERVIPHRYNFAAWNTIYRILHRAFGDDRYHMGVEVSSFTNGDDAVRVNFSDGSSREADLLVCADGIRSLARATVLPEVQPHYAGYVAWRGTVRESELSDATYAALHDSLSYQVLDKGHILIYPIPDETGDIRPGHRLMNIVWYFNADQETELPRLLTSRAGVKHDVSVPPGFLDLDVQAEVKARATATLAPPLAEVVTSIDDIFLQAVFDIDVPAMAFGRACIMGDAGFAARPHAAAGTAKAAEDAWVLVDELTKAEGDVPTALKAWEIRQLDMGKKLLARTKATGEASQIHGTFGPDWPTLIFGLYESGN
jgi:2,6-dihydroxypyridine 3-monooxygenase